MEARRYNVTQYSIEWQTREHKDRIDFYRTVLKKVDEDPDRKQRHLASECILCWKSARMGGATTTCRPCAFCGCQLSSGNTNVDVMCLACATAAGLCKHCGADIDLTNRRKRKLPEVVTMGDE